MVSELLKLSNSISQYVVGAEGNVSCKVPEGFYIKASGKSLQGLTENDLIFCDNQGYTASDLLPSIETGFHHWLLTNFDINYVAHTHPVNTLKVLCSNDAKSFSLNRLFPDQVVFNGAKSCLVKYAHPGEDLLIEIKKEVNRYISEQNELPRLILLKNHGIITIGKSIKECIISTEICEKSADIFLGSLSNPDYLTDRHIEKIINDEREKYRQSNS
jgi:ribulose-5-phosphate 4-epimerase/fuculose-1-phosphate aldolase